MRPFLHITETKQTCVIIQPQANSDLEGDEKTNYPLRFTLDSHDRCSQFNAEWHACVALLLKFHHNIYGYHFSRLKNSPTVETFVILRHSLSLCMYVWLHVSLVVYKIYIYLAVYMSRCLSLEHGSSDKYEYKLKISYNCVFIYLFIELTRNVHPSSQPLLFTKQWLQWTHSYCIANQIILMKSIIVTTVNNK